MALIPDKEVKKRFKQEVSKDPDAYFATKVLKEEGYARRQCACGTWFWSTTDKETCDDASCSGGFRFFENNPAKKPMDYIETWQAKGKVREYDISFTPDNDYGIYNAKINKQKLFFYYLPSTALEIEAFDTLDDVLQSSPAIMLTFNPNMSAENLQYVDIIRLDLQESLDKPVISAVTHEGSSYPLPVVTCDNASIEFPLFSFEIGEEPMIVNDGACVRLIANGTDFALVRDRLVYEYYDVYDE